MARDTRRRFNALVEELKPSLQSAFLNAIKDIKRGSDIQALERALEARDIDAALRALRLGQEFYAPLQEAARNVYVAGGAYFIDTLPRKNPATGLDLVVRFQGDHPRAQEFLRRQAARLVTDISDRQRDLVAEIIQRKLSEGVNPNTTALDLVGRVSSTGRRSGGVIGLTRNGVASVENFRQKLIADGVNDIDRRVDRFTNKKLLERGRVIARTETLTALNAGKLDSARGLIDQGQVATDAIVKVWDATGDARVRNSHNQLDGQTVGVDNPFITASGARLMHPGDTSLGAPAEETMQCRCFMAIIIDFLRGL